MEINYFGILRSPVSWAKIGRCLIIEFLKQNIDVCIYERKGFCFNKNWKLDFEEKIKNQFLYEKTLTFEYPLNYKLIPTKFKYGMLVYETTEVPKIWVENANRYLDILFLPNEFNRKIFIESGVNPDIIKIIPYGINPEIFNNKKINKKDSKFTFLCVCMPQKRKGIDLLIKAFEKLFKNDKNTQLILKFPYKSGKSDYDIKIECRSSNIIIIEKEFAEEEMVNLYKNADIFVLPSRAEGFGMIYLEALACGLPVIATGWGGHMDFLNNENAVLIDYKLVPAGNCQYDNKNGNGFMAEPDFDDLIEKMIFARKNIEFLKEKIKKIDLKEFYWYNIVKKIIGEIDAN